MIKLDNNKKLTGRHNMISRLFRVNSKPITHLLFVTAFVTFCSEAEAYINLAITRMNAAFAQEHPIFYFYYKHPLPTLGMLWIALYVVGYCILRWRNADALRKYWKWLLVASLPAAALILFIITVVMKWCCGMELI